MGGSIGGFTRPKEIGVELGDFPRGSASLNLRGQGLIGAADCKLGILLGLVNGVDVLVGAVIGVVKLLGLRVFHHGRQDA